MGFQRTVYYLGSRWRYVRVCVTVRLPRSPRNCPIEFPFDMRFRLVGATSGKLYTNNFICSINTLTSFPGSGVFKVDLTDDIIEDPQDDNYLILLFNACQVNFCFDIDLKDGVSRPGQGQRFPIEISRTPDQGRSTILDPVNAVIVIS